MCAAVVKGESQFSFYLIQAALYAGFLVFAEVPSSLGIIYLQKSIFQATGNYIERFSKEYNNKPIFNLETEFRKRQEVWLTTRSQRTIERSLTVLYNCTTIVFGIIFNIGIIFWAGGLVLEIGYAASFVFILISIKYFKKNFISLVKNAEENKGQLDCLLQTGWDNIVLGNTYNFAVWKSNFKKLLVSTKKSYISALVNQHFSEFSTRFIFTTPVLSAFLILIGINIDKPEILASLLVTLPLQMKVLPEICGIGSYIMLWNKMEVELDLLEDSIVEAKPAFQKINLNSLARINWGIIMFSHGNIKLVFNSIDEIIEKLNSMNNGKLTIRGSNGSGKSTIVSLLKQRLENAIYIPSNSKLSFNSTFEASGSTGEILRRQLEELFDYLDTAFNHCTIILDEWNANLDNITVLSICKLIEQLSKRFKIIEIIHREINVSVPIEKLKTPALI